MQSVAPQFDETKSRVIDVDHPGAIVEFCGIPASGKSTVAAALCARLELSASERPIGPEPEDWDSEYASIKDARRWNDVVGGIDALVDAGRIAAHTVRVGLCDRLAWRRARLMRGRLSRTRIIARARSNRWLVLSEGAVNYLVSVAMYGSRTNDTRPKAIAKRCLTSERHFAVFVDVDAEVEEVMRRIRVRAGLRVQDPMWLWREKSAGQNEAVAIISQYLSVQKRVYDAVVSTNPGQILRISARKAAEENARDIHRTIVRRLLHP